MTFLALLILTVNLSLAEKLYSSQVDFVEEALVEGLKANSNNSYQRMQLAWHYLQRIDLVKSSQQVKQILSYNPKYRPAVKLKNLINQVDKKDATYVNKKINEYLQLIDYQNLKPGPFFKRKGPVFQVAPERKRQLIDEVQAASARTPASIDGDILRYLTLAGIYSKSGLLTKAVSILKKSSHPLAASRLVLIHLENNKLSEAKKVLQKALKDNPKDVQLVVMDAKIKKIQKESNWHTTFEELVAENRVIEAQILKNIY